MRESLAGRYSRADTERHHPKIDVEIEMHEFSLQVSQEASRNKASTAVSRITRQVLLQSGDAPREDALIRKFEMTAFAAIVFVLLVGLIYPIARFGGWTHWATKVPNGITISVVAAFIRMIFSVVGAAFILYCLWKLQHRDSKEVNRYLHFAFVCVLLLWGCDTSLFWCRILFTDRTHHFVRVVGFLRFVACFVAIIASEFLVLLRVGVLESSMHRRLGGRWMLKLIYPQLVLIVVMVVATTISEVEKRKPCIPAFEGQNPCVRRLLVISRYIYAGSFSPFAACVVGYYCLAFKAFYKPYACLKQLAKRTDLVAKEAQIAVQVQGKELFGVTTSLIMSVYSLVGGQLYYFIIVQWERSIEKEWGFTLTKTIPGFTLALAQVYCAVAMSGVFGIIHSAQSAHVDEGETHDSIELRRANWRYQESGNKEWQRKVRELAGKGISLRAIMWFFMKLGSESLMPHYKPSKHTTEDVVRLAIIPFSKAKGTSCATVLMKDMYTHPEKMVTHNWGNLFRDLVASVVADALGECDFSLISDLLENNPSIVMNWLNNAAKLDCTYWICAFSVNQHSGICSSNPRGTTDTVTGLLHPVCDCGKEKCFNDTAPLSEDGKSIPCEMNKFVDMMAYLSWSDTSFEQVIATDKEFCLFSRAWCVAEISQAHRQGMRQHLKAHSRGSLEKREEKLRGLDVEKMEASRKEDVEEILATIEDKDAFNRHLQNLLFDKRSGLLVAWDGQDASQQMVRVGRLARFQKACGGRESFWESAGSP